MARIDNNAELTTGPIFRVMEVSLAAAALISVVRSATGIAGWLSARNRASLSWIPYAYVAEAVALTSLVLLALLLLQNRRDGPWMSVLWCSVGALTAFMLLSWWSIGGSFTPAVSCAATAGLVATIRTKTHLVQVIVWSVAGIAGQLLLMVLVILVFAGSSLKP